MVQDYIEDKSNEIPMGPELIKKLDLINCVLTADAVRKHCEVENNLHDQFDIVFKEYANRTLTLEK